jgi:hypothetical protein
MTQRPTPPAGFVERSLLGELRDAHVEERRLRAQAEQLVASTHSMSVMLLAAEGQANGLLKLVVAARRLIEARDGRDALAGLAEVITNVLGSEDFVVYGRRPGAARLAPLAGVGDAYARALGAQAAPAALETWLAERQVALRRCSGAVRLADQDIAICVPLTILDRVVGVIAIHQLLPHRAPLDASDDDVLGLLGAFAPTAILAADHRAGWTQLTVEEP